MKCSLRQQIYLGMASGIMVLHLLAAAMAKPSFGLTMYGDAVPCTLVVLAILAIRENFQSSPGILPAFWKVFAVGLTAMLFSQAFWFYFDWRQLNSASTPALGDSLFLVAHVFFLSALALRPYASSGGTDLRIRTLDFVLLSLWWLFVYGFFALPWKMLINDLRRYNLEYSLVAFFLHLVIVAALGFLCIKRRGAWRVFYLLLMVAFVLFAGGNLLMSGLFEGYYPGGFYDTPFLLGVYLFTLIAYFGSTLQPYEDAGPNRELLLSLWTARFAMLVTLSLPLAAIWVLRTAQVPQSIAVFRLRLVFGSMFVLGGLVYWKFTLLTRELVWLVRLTRNSIENLKSVQQQMSHSEKFVALGRLAAGAAHEISNPLTAILGYSELLADIPSLSPEDRANAEEIREQVHRAQAAVASLRNNMSLSASLSSLPASFSVDKKTFS